MKLKIAAIALVIGATMCCSESHATDLLNRMLNRGGCGTASSCCDAPAASCSDNCGGFSFNLSISFPRLGLFDRGCRGGFGGCGGGVVDSGCGGGCGGVVDSGCGGGCGGGVLSGGLMTGIFNGGAGCGCNSYVDNCGSRFGGMQLFSRGSGGCGCDTGCDSGCGGLDILGRVRGRLASLRGRLGNRGGCGCDTGCGAPVSDCGCDAAPACGNGCGGGLLSGVRGRLSGLRGRLGNNCGGGCDTGCGAVEMAPVSNCDPCASGRVGLRSRVSSLNLLRRSGNGCGCGTDPCGTTGCPGSGSDAGCGCGGAVAAPAMQGTPVMQGAPQQAPVMESAPTPIQPEAATPEAATPPADSGANYTPVVDPSAFIIRGASYSK